jgi:hypothetical protein
MISLFISSADHFRQWQIRVHRDRQLPISMIPNLPRKLAYLLASTNTQRPKISVVLRIRPDFVSDLLPLVGNLLSRFLCRQLASKELAYRSI